MNLQMEPISKFGLIIAKKKDNVSVKNSVFEQDSSEEDQSSKFNLSQQSKSKTFIRKQTQLHIESALSEDANIFNYDDSYEDDKKRRLEKEEQRFKEVCQASKPKYMGNLLRQAEERKKEKLLRTDRKVAKERRQEEDEGLYQDKERYETEAYKESRRMLQEEQRLRDKALKETDTGDFSGFYRHLFDQRTKSAKEVAEENAVENEKQNKKSPIKGIMESGRKTSHEEILQKRKHEEEEEEEEDRRGRKREDKSDRRKSESFNIDKRDKHKNVEKRDKKDKSEKADKIDEGKEEEDKLLPSKKTCNIDQARARYLARKNNHAPT